jgi:hypothetical protein
MNEKHQLLNSIFRLTSTICVYSPFEVVIVILAFFVSFSLLSTTATNDQSGRSSIEIKSSFLLSKTLPDKFYNDINTKQDVISF